MIAEVRIKVKKENVDGSITFKELSEGEQQLLTVLGLLKFTKDENSLILLDEPDTHLNPIWKWKYFEFLDKVVNNHKTTQIIINTHDPLVIGGLTKEEVRIFKIQDGKTIIEKSDKDPKGMGVAGILTSPLFGLPTILDKETQVKLNRKRYLQGRIMRDALDPKDYDEYYRLKAELENYGFYEEVEDQWFKMYLAEMSKHELMQKVEFTEEEKTILQDESKNAVERVFEKLKKEQA
jgi:ABC-type multidrug transport system ATPase subunit